MEKDGLFGSLSSLLENSALPSTRGEDLLSPDVRSLIFEAEQQVRDPQIGQLFDASLMPDVSDQTDDNASLSLITEPTAPEPSEEKVPDLFGEEREPDLKSIISRTQELKVTESPTSNRSPIDVQTLSELVNDLCVELRQNLLSILQLNPGRRELLLEHLARLSGGAGAPAGSGAQQDSKDRLRHWIVGPRSQAQENALRVYLEEVALICVAQCLLLKIWSEKHVRTWTEKDLSQLNWSLNAALKPHVPIHRESWQITKPNLYSWFNPSEPLRRRIHKTLSPLKLSQSDPSLLRSIIQSVQARRPHEASGEGYDHRFFEVLWKNIKHYGFDPFAKKQQRTLYPTLSEAIFAFTPTLRDGTLIRGATGIQWIGTESDPFLILIAEISILWEGPKAPPLWDQGTGLDVHRVEQLSMKWPTSKTSNISQIRDVESCWLAFVLEERSIRLHQKTLEAQTLKKSIEKLDYFSKLKSDRISLGALQAVVSITKLRPGGLLWWARETPLSHQEGQDVLKFILDQSTLKMEWDLSQIDHALPSQRPLFPKHLYLFQREMDLAVRSAHRPVRVQATGSIRSHVEVPILLKDSFQAPQSGYLSRSQWKVHVYVSPSQQLEWSDHWPEPASQETIQKLEGLRTRSTQLGQLSFIRKNKKSPDDQAQGPAAQAGRHKLPSLQLSVEAAEENCQLVVQTAVGADGVSRADWLAILSEEQFLIPVGQYLRSHWVRKWLDHFAEKKRGLWILSEEVLKFIPVPHSLLNAIREFQSLSLHPNLKALLNDIPYDPARVHQSLLDFERNVTKEMDLQGAFSALFVKASLSLNDLETQQRQLFSIVTEEGQIDWRPFCQILPERELVSFTRHADVRMTGSLPPHLPIHKISRLKGPYPRILFTTEAGLNLQVGSDNSQVTEILWNQVKDLNYPTWNELTQSTFIPRDLELAMATATDILRCHGEQVEKRKQLLDLIQWLEHRL